MNSGIWIIILLVGTIAIIGICILLILLLWQNQKIQESVTPLMNWFSLSKISIKDIIQTATSVIAILIAIYALTKDSLRDNDSSKRYSASVKMEKQQHQEIMAVYADQKELLLKYNQSADSMLEQQKTQAEIAKLQFKNQVILTQPGVNINYQVRDDLNTSLDFDNENWIMPEVIFQLNNFGSRIAKDVILEARFISPVTKKIHHFRKSIDPFLYPKATMNKLYYPIIDSKEKSFFLMVVDLEWTDEFNNNKRTKQRLVKKCIREGNNFYTVGVATGAHLNIVNDVLRNPAKVINGSEEIRKYMFDTYNR